MFLLFSFSLFFFNLFFTLGYFPSLNEGCPLVSLSKGTTAYTAPLLTPIPGYFLTQAYSSGFTDYTSLVVNLKDQSYRIATGDDVANAYTPNASQSFLLTPTSNPTTLQLALVGNTWVSSQSLRQFGNYHIWIQNVNETIVNITLALISFPNSNRSTSLVYFVSESLQSTFLISPSTIYVVPFAEPTTFTNFTSQLDVNFGIQPVLYDEENIVYITRPCCLCTPGDYFLFSTTSFRALPVQMGQSVFDSRTQNWINVNELGQVAVYNLSTQTTTTFQLSFTSKYWINLAISIPTIIGALSLFGILVYFTRSRFNSSAHKRLREEDNSTEIV